MGNRNFLEKYVRDYKIFIDTCSILSAGCESLLNDIIPLLNEYSKKIIIPLACINEVKKHAANQTDKELREKAKDGIRLLNKLKAADAVEIRADESDNFADNVFQRVFIQFRLNYRLLLITQDKTLAKDILAQNNMQSARGYPISVKRIIDNGHLIDFTFDDETGNTAQGAANQIRSGNPPHQNARKNRTDVGSRHQDNSGRREKPVIDKFKLPKTIVDIPDTVLAVSEYPSAGSLVYRGSDNALVNLQEELGVGGEAAVYSTDTDYVAKIYKKEKLTQRKLAKLQLMLSKEVNCPGICYPVDILYNSAHEFVGYLMPRAKGKKLSAKQFQPMLIPKYFPDWKRIDTVELCLTILKKIKYLHDRNIILGDINRENILVESTREVYIVDCDSFQIEGFPCPVCSVTFTAPEIQKKDFTDFLRSLGNEDFAVATLLFMLLLPGKSPYAQQGGEDPSTNIINMNFSYPFGDKSNKKTPPGKWRFIWSHLPYRIKKAFYETFAKGESHSTEDKRIPVGQWIELFKEYKKMLQDGKFLAQDPMSAELFPTRLKKIADGEYIICKLCGQETNAEFAKEGICPECLNNKGDVCTCTKCGKQFLFNNYEKLIRKAKVPGKCPDCWKHDQEEKMTLTCVSCGKTFTLTNGEYDFYTSGGRSLPKRCKDCRGKASGSGYRGSSGSRSYGGGSFGYGRKSNSGCLVVFAVGIIIPILLIACS